MSMVFADVYHYQSARTIEAKGCGRAICAPGSESPSLCILGAVHLPSASAWRVPPSRMELGALGDARFVKHPSFSSERQSLSLTAEGLLRELVEEHRDPAFEYRSLQGYKRCGKWVGGATPIEDNKTKYQFSTLALWCAQVSESVQLRLLPRVKARPVRCSWEQSPCFHL